MERRVGEDSKVDQAENGANTGSVVAQASVVASAGAVAPPADNSGASMIIQGSSAISGNTVRDDRWIYDTGFGGFFLPAGVDDGITFWTCNKCGRRRRQQRSKFYVDAIGSRSEKLNLQEDVESPQEVESARGRLGLRKESRSSLREVRPARGR